MNGLKISIKNIIHKPLSSGLSILLFAFGLSIILAILLTSSYLKNEIANNSKGIDLVVGAKGSPLQIILCSIFHVDFPTGNIALKDANNLTRNRLVKAAIPLSLGDSYKGYRIVGTSLDYPNLFGASLHEGDWFTRDMHAVAGAKVARKLGLSIGDKIESAHGLAEGAGGHEEHPFEVTGILEASGTVIDDLILVSVQSVWKVHGHEGHHEHEDESHHEWVDLPRLGIRVTKEQLDEEQITSLLIQYRSPMAAVQLPRIVNNISNLQAASPAYETARLFNIIGVGVDLINVLGGVIVLISSISVFIALINSLKERRYELAIMRAMGASRSRIFLMILTEGLIITFCGTLLGFLFSHLGYYVLIEKIGGNSGGLKFIGEELSILLGSCMVGIFASIIPAVLAYRSNISETLAKA